MFVDLGLWPPQPPVPPPPPNPPRLSRGQERKLGLALGFFTFAMFAAPLAGSSVVEGLVELVRAAVR